MLRWYLGSVGPGECVGANTAENKWNFHFDFFALRSQMVGWVCNLKDFPPFSPLATQERRISPDVDVDLIVSDQKRRRYFPSFKAPRLHHQTKKFDAFSSAVDVTLSDVARAELIRWAPRKKGPLITSSRSVIIIKEDAQQESNGLCSSHAHWPSFQHFGTWSHNWFNWVNVALRLNFIKESSSFELGLITAGSVGRV